MPYINHPTLGSIECVRSLRSRSIRLTMRSNGMLRLSYPIFTSAREALAFAESKSEWIESTRNKINQRREERPTITLHEGMELRRGAQRELPTLTERLAREHGFSYASLRISSARTRWGSCSGKNGISLSLFVMILPQHLREFIILHELCHTRHHNHSAAFHSLLDSCVGGREREYAKELREWRIPQIR